MKQRLLAWLKRYWLLLLVVAAFLALIVSRRVVIEELITVLLQGQWQWILAATLLQVGYFLLFALLYHYAFAAVQVRSRLPDLVPVLFAAVLVNAVAPAGGLGGAALFVDDAARRGESAARATEGVLLELVIETAALLPLLLIGLGYLFLRGLLQTYLAVGAAIYLLYVGILSAAVLAGRWRPGSLRSVLGWLQQAIDRLAARFRRPGLAPDWAAKNAAGFTAAANAISAHSREVERAAAMALGLQLVNLASVRAVFEAFRQPMGLGELTSGYAFGFSFAIISVLPLDAGVMQAVMILVYTLLGVPAVSAVVIVLAWGGLNAWLPLAIGFLLLRQVRSLGRGGAR